MQLVSTVRFHLEERGSIPAERILHFLLLHFLFFVGVVSELRHVESTEANKTGYLLAIS